MTPSEQTARGDRAKLLLEDDLLIEAFATIRAYWHEQWENSGGSDVEVREEAWRQISALLSLKDYLESVLHTGNMIQMQLTGDSN